MGRLADRINEWLGVARSVYPPDPGFGIDAFSPFMNFAGNQYSIPLQQTMPGSTVEQIDSNFQSLVSQAYRQNGIVFACMLARFQLFSEARFQFRRMSNGRPGDLFGTAALDILEHPWPGGTTGDLLTKAIVHADLAGNAFLALRPGPRIRLLRPDWVTIVLGSEDDADVTSDDIDATVLGYLYHPGGRASGKTPEVLMRDQVAHFAPVPDPLASYRGMSWLTPVIREIMADSAATNHKMKFFENGATPNMVVVLDKDIATQAFKEWVEIFKKKEPTRSQAYKTMYLGAGAKIEVVGKDLQQLEFKTTQGAGETRIAAAAGIHPVIVGLSEGLQGSSLNAGNFQSARRLVADRTMRPLWRNMAGSLETIIPTPTGANLWYDDRDVSFLREDRKDAAEMQQLKSVTINQLVTAGYEPDSVVKAVEAENMSLLVHSGLYSVQLQPPNPDTGKPEPIPTDTTPLTPDMPASNGTKPVSTGAKP